MIELAKNKGGRPPLVPGARRRKAKVYLTHEQQIALRRLGGSAWARSVIDAATPGSHERYNQTTVSVSGPQHAKFLELGGAAWLRAQIEAATK